LYNHHYQIESYTQISFNHFAYYILQKYYITAPQQQLHISQTFMTVNRFKALD